jgi:serine/threonine protein kinase
LFTSRAETSYFVTDLETVINSVMGISKHAAYLMETSAFAMIKKIAIGGGGELYLTGVMVPALRKKIGETVIQKIIFVKNDASREAFYQEIGIMIMLLPFPNFCRILGYTENPMSIIMEFYPDGSLNEWLKTRICSKGNLLKILREISQGLNVMHSYFLAHCDLKPQNILVKVSNGIPSFFITDFGITQVLSESIIAAKSFNIINLRGLSVHYASPEAFTSFRTKKYSSVDFRMFDVYSFGCLTYEVQTRRMPWV